MKQHDEESVLADRPEHPEEACGVFGVYAPGEDVARLTYFGLHALQHRGQESAGIAVGDHETVTVTKNLGLVSRVFRESDLDSLTGDVAIGHTRYSTTGSSTSWENAQPHLSTIGLQVIALAHNGNLVNTHELREDLKGRGLRFRSTTDSEVIATLIGEFTVASHQLRAGIAETMKLIRGAYAVVLITEEALYAFRDPHGVRPIVIGKLDERGWVVSSETCGLDIVGAVPRRGASEAIKISADGLESIQAVPADQPSLCMFSSSPSRSADSGCMAHGSTGHAAEWARAWLEADVDADLVIGVPIRDSGCSRICRAAAFRTERHQNRYVGRHSSRQPRCIAKYPCKLNPLSLIKAKRLVVVDDSIVQGSDQEAFALCARPVLLKCTWESHHRRSYGHASTGSTRIRRNS
jgi:amidophosphoribosyltransferase